MNPNESRDLLNDVEAFCQEIRPVEELSEEEKPFIEKNAAYFSK